MKIKLLLLFTLLLSFSCAHNSKKEHRSPIKGSYFSQIADTIPSVFAPGIVSRAFQELNAVFSPDGKEFYYTLADPARSFYVIMMMTMNEKGEWVGPEVAPFSGKYADADPFLTSDNKSLYFISKRPIDGSGTEKNDFDLWKVDRTNKGWTEAIRLDSTINTDKNEYYVSVTDKGSIFFSAQYETGYGYGDIYEAKPINGSYEISNVGPAINTTKGEGDPYISPDGKMLIFMSWGRNDDLGGGDLYISYKKDGVWQEAQNMGQKINSSNFEYCPMISPDGKYFFWTSYRSDPLTNPNGYTYQSYLERINGYNNGLGNIYWIKTEVLNAFK